MSPIELSFDQRSSETDALCSEIVAARFVLKSITYFGSEIGHLPTAGSPRGKIEVSVLSLLRVEAPGYATLVRTIELSRDVAKEFELTPEATPGIVAPPKPTRRRDDPWGI